MERRPPFADFIILHRLHKSFVVQIANRSPSRTMTLSSQLQHSNYELVAVSLNNKAALLQLQGDMSDSYVLYKEALSISSRWGEDVNSLPLHEREVMKDEAETRSRTIRDASMVLNFEDPLSVQVEENCGIQLGHDFISLTLLYNLSMFSICANHSSGALHFLRLVSTLLDNSEALRKSIHHTFFLAVHYNMARVTAEIGHIDQAITLYTETIRMASEAEGENNFLLASTFTSLAGLLLRGGYKDDAVIVMQRAMDVHEQQARVFTTYESVHQGADRKSVV